MKSKESIQNTRHSLAHLLGSALIKLYPGTKLAIGPAIENGFYYDAQIPKAISTEDLPTIEKKMREMYKTWSSFNKRVVSEKEALEIFSDNPYKKELIKEFSNEDKELTIYESDGFVDLCGGGHVKNMKNINLDGFSLVSVAGAYWRGDEKNKMLTRIYGLAFNSKKELEEYKEMFEKAKERDHRKLGKELGLFTFSNIIGPGLPLFTPKGTALRKAIEDVISKLLDKYGYERVWIPHLSKPELYKISGHLDKFKEELFKVKGKRDEFILKPMNCPHHTQIYAQSPKSYHDLPVRYAELTTVYRDEQKGELLGLSRVLSITQDDGHIFCTKDQIEDEVSNATAMILEFYKILGFMKTNDDCEVYLSVRGEDKNKYLGDDKVWDLSEKVLKKALEKNKLKYITEEDEAAFYGPKIDFHFRDSLKRKRQLATIQLDFVMPERFKLVYTDSKNKKQTPVMIHRAISGSLERFIAIMIEHFNGNFPFFLSPVQVRVIPISDSEVEYSEKMLKLLKENKLRSDMDKTNEPIGKKILRTHKEKIPTRIIIGKNEVDQNKVTLEYGDEKKLLTIEECIKILEEKNSY